MVGSLQVYTAVSYTSCVVSPSPGPFPFVSTPPDSPSLLIVVCALTTGDPDPAGARLALLKEALEDNPDIEALFWDVRTSLTF